MEREELAMLAGRLRIRLESDRMFGVDFARRPFSSPSVLSEEPARTPAALPPGEAADPLASLASEKASCSDCPLASSRRNLVFGEGHPQAVLMFVGEAPGADEDREGRPFIGRAGRLLTRIIEAMGFSREEVYIANVLKCRPPRNRDPAPAEVAACLPVLLRQIEIIDPRVIVTLGNHALFALVGPGPGRGIKAMRGKFLDAHGRKLMPTFHPAYLLRNEGAKRNVWEDMKKVLGFLGRTPPPRGGGSKTA